MAPAIVEKFCRGSTSELGLARYESWSFRFEVLEYLNLATASVSNVHKSLGRVLESAHTGFPQSTCSDFSLETMQHLNRSTFVENHTAEVIGRSRVHLPPLITSYDQFPPDPV